MKDSEREAKRWFLQAADDFKFVQWMLKEGVFFDKGCFVAQQAGENALKSCLYGTGKRRVIGHALLEMINELIGIDKEFVKLQGQAKRLDRFYITTRYPNGLPGVSTFNFYTKTDLSEATGDLNTIFVVSRRFLS